MPCTYHALKPKAFEVFYCNLDIWFLNLNPTYNELLVTIATVIWNLNIIGPDFLQLMS